MNPKCILRMAVSFLALALTTSSSAHIHLSSLNETETQVPAESLVQPAFIVPSTSDAQRQAMNNVRTRIDWLKNAARTAPSYASGGDGLVWRALQALRAEYTMFTRTLTPRQLTYGANELAELSAGLDILEEAIANYCDDVASGRLPSQALRDMCQVMSRAAAVWLEEFKKDCLGLRVGR